MHSFGDSLLIFCGLVLEEILPNMLKFWCSFVGCLLLFPRLTCETILLLSYPLVKRPRYHTTEETMIVSYATA